MTESNRSGLKPGSPEWQARLNREIEQHDAARAAGEVTLSGREFAVWLGWLWVADLVSEPEPEMPELDATLARLLAGVA